MNILCHDLDKFLKTDGIQILIESCAVRKDSSGYLVWVDSEEDDENKEDE